MPWLFRVSLFLLTAVQTFGVREEPYTTFTGEEAASVSVAERALTLEENGRELNIAEVLDADTQGRFRANRRQTIVNSVNTGSYWIKIQVLNQSQITVWLELAALHVWYADLYVAAGGKYRLAAQGGSLLPENVSVNLGNFTWFPVASSEKLQTFYLRIVQFPGPHVPMTIGTARQLTDQKAIRDYTTAAFVGAMLMTFLYYLFLYFSTREKIYLWYILYVAAAALSATFICNYALISICVPAGWRDVWLRHSSWIYSTYMCVGFFAISFLNLRRYRKIHITIQIFLVVFGVLLPLKDVLGLFPSISLIAAAAPFQAGFPIFMLGVGIYLSLWRREKRALLYVIAWLGPLGSTIIQLLLINGIIRLNIFTENNLYIGITWEVMLFSLALANRINDLNRELVDRNKIEAELDAKRVTAEAIAASKASFLSTMSHEIRTPLSSVIGMASLLSETKLKDEQRRYVEIISRSGNNLLTLINDILDYSRLDSGKLQLTAEKFSPNDTLNGILQLMSLSADQKNITLTGHVEAGVPDELVGDDFRLRQILLNLIGNAIKFTEAGGVTVTVMLINTEYDKALVEFRVVDTGIGIPAESLAILFQPFTQVDSTVARKFGGSGLGLSICRELTELMGGTISVSSTVGVGAALTLRIPFSLPGTKYERD